MIPTASLFPDPPRRRHEEETLQKQIVTFAKWALPDNAMMFAVPNGGLRHTKAAARLIGQGVTAGISDLILWHAGRTLGIEVKLPSTYPSEVQRQMRARMERCGIQTVIVRSLDEWCSRVREFGVPLRIHDDA